MVPGHVFWEYSSLSMVEDRGQLAVAGGQLPVAANEAGGDASGIALWIQTHVTPDSVLSFADRHRRLLGLVVLFFYLAAFNGQWRIQPDAALYLTLGRNLATGRGYTYLGHPDHLAYPGWPVLIAATFKIFGLNSLVAVNALMALIALTTVAMVYRLFLLHSGRPTAVVISVGVGLTKAFFCYGFELWSDMPFALGAVSALAGYEGLFGHNARNAQPQPIRKRWIDGFFLTGGILFAASMRPTIWPLLAAMGLSIAAQTLLGQIRWRTFFAIASVAIAVAGIASVVWWRRAGIGGFGGVYEEYLINRISGRASDGLTHPLVQNIRDLFGWAASDVLFQIRLGSVCNALLSTIVLGVGFGLFRYRLLWGFWFSLLLAVILVSQETLDRYFLPVLPLLVYGWWELLLWCYSACRDWAPRLTVPRYVPHLVFLSLISFGCLMNLTRVGGIVIQQRQQPFLASFDKGIFDVAPRFSQLLHDRVDEKAIVLMPAPYGRVTEYLSERNITGALGASVDDLKNRQVFVVEPSDLSTQRLLRAAGLVEEAALFTVYPSAGHGPLAVPLSLHPTRARR